MHVRYYYICGGCNKKIDVTFVMNQKELNFKYDYETNETINKN